MSKIPWKDIAVSCRGVSIRYITGNLKSVGLKEYLIRRLYRSNQVREFTAVSDISFDLVKGDMLGIIGSNGAGKSTLLKALAGVIKPSEGEVKTQGTMAALLELGSGFDANMTVRENTYLRGAILGYPKKTIMEKYEEIIAFAELEEFQDRCFRQLSSGMKSRLAFSIVCLLDPDIIILDEVLAVGDSAFRRKSGKKMREILSGGITGILVSHQSENIRKLCNRVLWLEKGRQIAFTDDVNGCCDAYETYMNDRTAPPRFHEKAKEGEI